MRISCNRDECFARIKCLKTIDVQYEKGEVYWGCIDRKAFMRIELTDVREFVSFEGTSLLGWRIFWEQVK